MADIRALNRVSRICPVGCPVGCPVSGRAKGGGVPSERPLRSRALTGHPPTPGGRPVPRARAWDRQGQGPELVAELVGVGGLDA